MFFQDVIFSENIKTKTWKRINRTRFLFSVVLLVAQFVNISLLISIFDEASAQPDINYDEATWLDTFSDSTGIASSSNAVVSGGSVGFPPSPIIQTTRAEFTSGTASSTRTNYTSGGEVELLEGTWTEVTAAAPWKNNRYYSSVSFNDSIWVLGGHTSNVWTSETGLDWALATTAPWTAREEHTSVVFDSKMWVIGGYKFGSVNETLMTSGILQTARTGQKPLILPLGQPGKSTLQSFLIIRYG